MSSFPLVSFLITLLLAAAVCTHGEEHVRDTSGDLVQTNKRYFIQVVNNKTNGGGLFPAFPLRLPPFCPLGIRQLLLRNQSGIPVSFKFPHPHTGKDVSTKDIVNIEFRSTIWPFCPKFSKLWEVDESLSASKEPAILIGGERTRPNSLFRIEKAGANGTYKFTSFTGTIGTIPGLWGNPQLLLTNDTAKTLLVKFENVDDASTATTTSSRVDEKLGLRMFPFY